PRIRERDDLVAAPSVSLQIFEVFLYLLRAAKKRQLRPPVSELKRSGEIGHGSTRVQLRRLWRNLDLESDEVDGGSIVLLLKKFRLELCVWPRREEVFNPSGLVFHLNPDNRCQLPRNHLENLEHLKRLHFQQ